jgi:hypothetical protein
MKNKLYIILCIVFIALVSCKKFLDTKPTSFGSPVTYYANASQMQTALNGVYDILGQGGVYNGGIGYTLTGTTDESSPRNTGVAVELKYIYDAGDATIASSWQTLYAGIERANLLLQSFQTTDNTDAATKSLIKGQALFLRSYYYFLLVRGWGDVPLILQPTASINNPNVARTQAAAVYQQITADMKTADTLLQTQTVTSLGYNGKVTKTAVEGILARVYLTWAGYPISDATQYKNSQIYINKVIADGEHSLNPAYAQIFLNLMENIEETKESIWEVEYYGNGTAPANEANSILGNLMSPLGDVIGGLNGGTISSGTTAGHLLITKTLYDNYATWDTTRRNWNCLTYNYASSGNIPIYPKTDQIGTNEWLYTIGKWRPEYSKLTGTNTSCNYPMLRYSDILLMQAEVETQINSGPTPTAYNAINEVRRRAFKVPVNTPNAICDVPAGLGLTDFMTILQAERMREFCFEGIRFWDLRRWGNMYNIMQTVSQSAAATSGSVYGIGGGSLVVTASAAFQPRNNLFPIPTHEMSLNASLKQNSGW